MVIEILGFVAIVGIGLAAWAHFFPTQAAAVTAKLPQSAVEASVIASNAAEKATAAVIKADIAVMRKWFSAAAKPHLDALDAENETYLTEATATK